MLRVQGREKKFGVCAVRLFSTLRTFGRSDGGRRGRENNAIFPALCSQTGVFSPRWKVDLEQSVVRLGVGDELSCSEPSEKE
ncbi:uncharacterized protein ACO6RY_00446 [Pungitius sinensis]